MIEGVSAAQQSAPEQHLRLRSPQPWSELTKSVETYMQTMYTSAGHDSTPMDISAVTMMTSGNCLCCGRTGHTKKDCKFKDETCRTCGKQGQISTVCRGGGSGSKGGQKGKTNGKFKDSKGGDKNCLFCGRKGHVRNNCRFKDEKCSN